MAKKRGERFRDRPDDRQIGIRMTDADYRRVFLAASACGLSVGRYVKGLALGEHYEPLAPKFSREDAAAIRKDLSRIGNNLNQIARNSNMGIPIESVNDANDCLKKLLKAVRYGGH